MSEGKGTNVYKLKKPFVFEEKEYTELTLNFEGLSGEDLIKAERSYKADNPGLRPDYVKEASKGYLAYVVAIAANQPPELIKALPAKDFSSVTLEAQHFLLM